MKRQLTLLALLAAVAAPAFAHPLAPSLLDLTEESGGRVTALWRRPQVLPVGARLEPRLPSQCRAVTPAAETAEGAALVRRWTADCGDAGLAGGTIAVAGLADAGSDALLRVTLADGTRRRAVLRPDTPFFVLPAAQTSAAVAAGYLTLGVEHLLGGWDHLAFVLGLVLLVWARRRPDDLAAPREDRASVRRPGRSRMRRLLATVTAFTLGHSVTLSLATLGLIRLPPAPIEAAIALSILVLAVELARRGPLASSREGLLSRRPWLMAAGFGLLHGLGFAGALADVGLPAREIPLALAAFNLGIELAQLAVVSAVLTAVYTARRLLVRLPTWTTALPTYAIGTLAAYWMLERLASL